MSVYRRHGKRLLDLAFSTLALVFLAPLLALTALLVRLTLGAPVLFRQQRPGRHGQPFTIYKFRTMTADRDACSALTIRPGCARMSIKSAQSDNRGVQRGDDGARKAFHVQGSGAAAHPVPDPSN